MKSMKQKWVSLLLAGVLLLAQPIMALAGEVPAGDGPAVQSGGIENQVLDLKFEGNLDDASGAGNNGAFSGSNYEYVAGVAEGSQAL